jgi:hypothetical protein
MGELFRIEVDRRMTSNGEIIGLDLLGPFLGDISK